MHIVAGDLNSAGNWFTHILALTKRSRAEPWHMSECMWWKRSVLPSMSYYDPFSCRDWTLQNAAVYGEKLDWILVSERDRISGFGMGDFCSSDHRPLWVDIRI